MRMIEAEYLQGHSLRPLFRLTECFGRDEITARTVPAACVGQFVKSRDVLDFAFRRPEQKAAALIGIHPPGVHPYPLNEMIGEYQHDELFLPEEFVKIFGPVVREDRDHHPSFKPLGNPDGSDRRCP